MYVCMYVCVYVRTYVCMSSCYVVTFSNCSLPPRRKRYVSALAKVKPNAVLILVNSRIQHSSVLNVKVKKH